MGDGFFSLIKQRRFAPLFFSQFLGAFIDNAFRSALVVLVTYHESLARGYDRRLIVTLVGGIMILPFFLFSSLAGQLADRYEKSRLVVIIKTLEMLTMSIGIYALFSESLFLLIGVLFMLMTQTTFFGPLKYSLLPVYLKPEEIVGGNALIESSTFVAILVGSIFGGIAISLPHYSIHVMSLILMSSAIIAWIFTWYLPLAPASSPKLKINFNLYQESLSIIKASSRNRTLFLAIVGISWFWVVGGIFLTQLTTYGKDILGTNENVAILFMVIFTIGIGLGSFLCTTLSKGRVDPRHIAWGAIGMTLFILDLVVASHMIDLTVPETIGIQQYLLHGQNWGNHWRILFDLLMISVSGGLYTVPLYTLLQTESDTKSRSRTIAANNIMNSFFMVISTIVSMMLVKVNVRITNIFLITGLFNLFVIHRISRLVPESILQLFMQGLLKLIFRVEVKGLENFHKAGKRVLIIANHPSYLDSILFFAFLPERLSYAIYSYAAQKWWIRIITSGVNLFPVDPLHPMAMKRLIEYLKEDRKCVIFPEGRVTITGSLMKIYDGPGMVADRAGATILPIRIDGAQYSLFSRLGGIVRRQIAPKITLTIMPPRIIRANKDLRWRERRKVISNQVYDLMVGMLFETSPLETPLFEALIDAGKRHGMGHEIVEDAQRIPITYRKLLMRSFILGRHLAKCTIPGEYVGILLPTTIASLVSFFGLLSTGRVPAMLNFSLGSQNLKDTCTLARIRLVLTSRQFIETAKLESCLDGLSQDCEILYLEDLRPQITTPAKLLGLLSSYFPNSANRAYSRVIKSDDPAVILFTSGSEGTPKGVALSHKNINANRFQIISSIDFNPQDVVMNVLPMFHSFGLTGGTLVPLLEGIRSFYYPSPLHYRRIPTMAYDVDATIFFATDTFLNRYAKLAHPYDFYATRYVFAGAEKLQPETRRLWSEKFGLQILEAYGTTETAPALCLNTRMHNKIGTVGRFLPALSYYIKPVEGVAEGGKLYVKGPNVMLGYINAKTGKITPTASDFGAGVKKGWYDTGDVINLDIEGFVTIQGRIKRFAKIGGEMISLVAIEERIQLIWPEHKHVVLAFPDTRKGEQLILLTTADLTREIVGSQLKSQGISEISMPRRIFVVEQVPLLATGKVDFQQAKVLAENLMATERVI